MSNAGRITAGSVGYLGKNGRLVYVQVVTDYVAYVISLPEQHDDTQDQDRRFLGPTKAIAVSPFVDFYTVDSTLLSEKNLDYIEHLTDFTERQYRLRKGKNPLMVKGTKVLPGQEVSLTNAEAIILGDRVISADQVETVQTIQPKKQEGPPPLCVELIHSNGLGKSYRRVYATLEVMPKKPSIKEVIPRIIAEMKKEGQIWTEASADWHLHNMAKLGYIRIVS